MPTTIGSLPAAKTIGTSVAARFVEREHWCLQRHTRMLFERVISYTGEKRGRPKPPSLSFTRRGRLLLADLPDHARAWDLEERTVLGGADKMGLGADVAHCTVIHDVGAPIRPEPDIERAVEPGSMAGTDERLFTGVVAGKPHDLEGERLVLLALVLLVLVLLVLALLARIRAGGHQH